MNAPRRNLATIVPAGVTFLVICGLIVVARFYQYLPIKPAPCGFRQIVGIPCLGCGGTRCMMALSHGNLVQSFLFNPAVFAGVLVVLVWFLIALRRYFKSAGENWPTPLTKRQRQLRKLFLTVGLPILVLLNWIYLSIYLPDA